MDELEKYIKKCNLIFTGTLKRKDFCMSSFPGVENVKVNNENSISILNFISSFNKLYVAFQKEYETLEKINLGETVEIDSFGKFTSNNDNYRTLILHIDEPTITDWNYTTLYLREINGQIKPFITNNLSFLDKNYYRENIHIDEHLAKGYLDFFEKYDLLLKTFNYLKNCQLFGDGTHYIFINIDEYEANLLKDLNKLYLSFGSAYFSTEYYGKLAFNLGDNFGLDYANCKLVLDSKEIPKNPANFDYILNNLYLNKEYTKKKER